VKSPVFTHPLSSAPGSNKTSKGASMEETNYVKNVTLATELDKRVAFAEVVIGEIAIKGITVWRSSNGRLSVYFPSFRTAHRTFDDCVAVPPELRSEVEAEVIAAYRTKKSESDKSARPAMANSPVTTTK
jgi:DNA-binding cell septation regulator SpoVG